MTRPDAFEPEIGQVAFGQPSQQFAVPDIMEAVLARIDVEYARVYWNIHQEEYWSPFGNNGAGCNLKTDVFEVQGYSWGEEEQPYNFAWRDLRISWYKWQGRGMSANMAITPDLAAQCLEECLASLQALEAQHDPS